MTSETTARPESTPRHERDTRSRQSAILPASPLKRRVVVHFAAREDRDIPPWLSNGHELPGDAKRLVEKQGRCLLKWTPPGESSAVYLKYHIEVSSLRRFAAVLWPTRGWTPATEELRNLQLARRAGVPVPEPVGAVEMVGPGLSLRGIFAVRELVGYAPLHELLYEASLSLTDREYHDYLEAVLSGVAAIAARLHGKRLFHKDLYLCHFFGRRSSSSDPVALGRSLVLIDFHRLQRHRVAYLHWQVKDLAQLGYSLKEIGAPERALEGLLASYFDNLRYPRLARLAIGHLVRRKVARYWKHNRRHGTVWIPSQRHAA